jgi:hypothetical protein
MGERRVERPPASIARRVLRARHEPAARVVLAAFLALVCTALIAPAAGAQTSLRFDVAGGVALPLSPSAITDRWNTGFTLSAALRWRIGSRFLLGPDVSYTRFGFDTDAFEATIADSFPSVNVGGNDLYVVSTLLDAEYALSDWGNTRPVARAGIGWAHADVTDPTASGPNATRVTLPAPGGDAVTLRLGFGVRTLLTPVMTLFVDAAWQIAWLDPEPLQFVPVRLGVRF